MRIRSVKPDYWQSLTVAQLSRILGEGGGTAGESAEPAGGEPPATPDQPAQPEQPAEPSDSTPPPAETPSDEPEPPIAPPLS